MCQCYITAMIIVYFQVTILSFSGFADAIRHLQLCTVSIIHCLHAINQFRAHQSLPYNYVLMNNLFLSQTLLLAMLQVKAYVYSNYMVKIDVL